MSVSDTPRRVLVAGGAGYIGSHTAKQLRASGYEPVVLDNLSRGSRQALRFGEFVEGSIDDAALVRRTLRELDIRAVMLFAGFAYVGESTVEPHKYYANNIGAAIRFLESLLETGVKQLVFSSSCSIYGQHGNGPISESTPKNPLSPYAESKWFFEQMLHWYGKAYGLQSACLRYFNAGGADPEGELGENHEPETHLIPLAIQAALGGAPLRVFGTDYPTPDGTAIRDYIHVSDLADAHVLALEHLAGGSTGFAVNLGTGQGHSVQQVIDTVTRISGRTVAVEYGPRREGDAPELVADPRLAQALLGWQARRSSLEQIVSTAWNWYRRP